MHVRYNLLRLFLWSVDLCEKSVKLMERFLEHQWLWYTPFLDNLCYPAWHGIISWANSWPKVKWPIVA